MRAPDPPALFVPIALALALVGCGGAPPASPPPPSPPIDPVAAPSGAPTAAPTPASGGAEAPSAKVLGVAVSDKGDHFTRVTVSFENKTGRSCTLTSYVVSWDGGSKEFPLESFVLAAGESKTRAARVHAGEGDITRLTTAEGTKVELKASCK